MRVSEPARQPVVSSSQLIAAGMASAMAAVITSRFGVAGTLIGAALTSMIITGGSAILKSYLESVTGNVRNVPKKMRAKANRRRAGRSDPPATVPERPDLRENFAGRMRAALGWFSHLPTLRRRSIMVKGLIGALVAFVIGMGVVTVAETSVLGGSLSCKLWRECPVASSASGATSATSGPSSTFGRIVGGSGSSWDQTLDPNQQEADGGLFSDPNVQPADPPVPLEPDQSVDPGAPVQPVPSDEQAPPAGSGVESAPEE